MLKALCIASVGSIAACGDYEPTQSVDVRDSAGVQIVETRLLPLRADAPQLVVDSLVAVIGHTNAPEPYQLYRVTTALRLPNRNVLVLDGGTAELRYFDSTGVYLYSRGGLGDGPGEFRRFWGAWLVGDSLFVFDWGRDRLTVLSALGEYGRTVMLQRGPGPATPMVLGVFRDGSLLASRRIYTAPPTSGFRRDTSRYFHYAGDGTLLDTLGSFAGRDHYSLRTDFGAIAADAPFGRRPTTVVYQDHFYYASTASYQIDLYSPSGTLERIVRAPDPPRPVTASDRAAYTQSTLSDADQWGPDVRRLLQGMAFPQVMPAHGKVVIDATGRLWIAEYEWNGQRSQSRWVVVGPHGRLIAQVAAAPGGRITDIGTDYLLGVWRGADDVEQVRVYRISTTSD